MKAEDAECRAQFGSKAEREASGGCKCVQGYIQAAESDASAVGACLKGSAKVCAGRLGANAEFDGVNSCRCRRGHVYVEKQGCVAGSDGVCQATMGPHSRFDGVFACDCLHGFLPDANGTCVRGSSEDCAAWHGLASFDGKACVCHQGTMPVEAADDAGSAGGGEECERGEHVKQPAPTVKLIGEATTRQVFGAV